MFNPIPALFRVHGIVTLYKKIIKINKKAEVLNKSLVHIPFTFIRSQYLTFKAKVNDNKKIKYCSDFTVHYVNAAMHEYVFVKYGLQSSVIFTAVQYSFPTNPDEIPSTCGAVATFHRYLISSSCP